MESNKPSTFILPARTKKLVSLITADNNISEGYLPKINAEQGIFIGENLVKSVNGQVKVFATNSTLRDVKLSIPPIKIEEVDLPALGSKNY